MQHLRNMTFSVDCICTTQEHGCHASVCSIVKQGSAVVVCITMH